MSQHVIIVAGGIGARMESDIPKQFLLLHGTPILMHTIRMFEDYNIVVVLPDEHHSYWLQLCSQHDFQIHHQVINGGSTRFQSVKNGLGSIPNNGLVAIHDGVRPLVSLETIKLSFELARQHGSAIASVPLKDSIREVADGVNKAKDRSNYQLIQTPQTFDIALIQKAYLEKESPLFTDDASVLENNGQSVHLFEGTYSNIKITTVEDLIIAEALIRF